MRRLGILLLKERAMYILKKTGVTGIPVEAFFQANRERQFIKFNFAKRDADLNETCERLKKLV